MPFDDARNHSTGFHILILLTFYHNFYNGLKQCTHFIRERVEQAHPSDLSQTVDLNVKHAWKWSTLMCACA